MTEQYLTSSGHVFEIIAEYTPNEDNDVWVEYVNILTKQKYTCRKEAFLARTFRQLA